VVSAIGRSVIRALCRIRRRGRAQGGEDFMAVDGWLRACETSSCVEVLRVENQGWHKSSKCEAGACVEVAAVRCEAGNCVQASWAPGVGVVLRNSQRPDEVITCDAQEWDAFVAGVKAGEFDTDRVIDDAV
jgi:hypothetical protein